MYVGNIKIDVYIYDLMHGNLPKIYNHKKENDGQMLTLYHSYSIPEISLTLSSYFIPPWYHPP